MTVLTFVLHLNQSSTKSYLYCCLGICVTLDVSESLSPFLWVGGAYYSPGRSSILSVSCTSYMSSISGRSHTHTHTVMIVWEILPNVTCSVGENESVTLT